MKLLLEAPEWDPDKREKVLRKHRVDFFDVAEVFLTGDFVDYEPVVDSTGKYGELREIFIGELDSNVYRGILTIRRSDERLITARRASRKERAQFSGKEVNQCTDRRNMAIDD